MHSSACVDPTIRFQVCLPAFSGAAVSAAAGSESRWRLPSVCAAWFKPRYVLLLVGVAAVHALSAKLGLSLAFVEQKVTLVWPPAGIALAAVVLFGPGMLSAVLVGALVANAASGSPPLFVAAATLANGAGAYVGFRVLERLAFRGAMDRGRDVAALLAASCAGMLVSATVGVTGLCLSGAAAWSVFGRVWGGWWMGDTTGALLVAPPILTWLSISTSDRCVLHRTGETAVFLAALTVVCGIVFFVPAGSRQGAWLPAAGLCPLLIVGAFRYGPRGASSAVLITCVLAIAGTVHGTGPFAGGTVQESLLTLLVFMEILWLSALVPAAVFAESEQVGEGLRQERDFAESLVETAQALVLVLDPQGRIVRFNSYAARLLGCRLDEVKGRDWVSIFLPDEDHAASREQFRTALGGCPTCGSIGVVLTRDGKRCDIEWYDHALSGAHGQVIGLLSIGLDVTARRQAEAQLRQQQKLAAIGTLAGGVAHEINNPVNGIMNYAQLILDDDVHEGEEREYAQQIIQESKRVADIVRSLLQFARHDKRKRRPTRVVDIVHDTLALIRTTVKRDQIRLDVSVPEDLPKVTCRSQEIQQVLMNLLANARDALNERYPTFDEDKVMRVTAGCFEKGDGTLWVRTTVEDHGAGIPEDVRDVLFDPFVTTKRPDRGTGLGLSVSQSIAQKHGGELAFDCELGRCTRFHLDLPAGSAPEAGGESGTDA